MKDYNEVKENINKDFKDYLIKLTNIEKEPIKYYYWSLNFFETVGGLSFQHYNLTDKQKYFINEGGKILFESIETSFEISGNIHRPDLKINYYYKLFNDKNKNGQTHRYEYIKEYALWKILINLHNEKLISPIILQKQKNNFLTSYITYLITHTKTTLFEYIKGYKDKEGDEIKYIKFNLTSQGANLIEKLDELDSKGFNNSILRNKIQQLYVLKKFENKLHFIFSKEGGGGKEELRELLDVMGRDDTGSYYRGQANSSWQLDSSLTRETKYLNKESQLYYDILSLKPDSFNDDHTPYERLITMQHFGMPTRLLDITRNPLVSIFFSCNNSEEKNFDSIIFTFSPKEEEFLNFENKRLKCLTKIVEDNDKSKICENCDNIDDCKYISDKKNTPIKLPDFFYKNWFVKGVAKNQRINSQSGDFVFVGLDNANKKLNSLPNLTIIIDSATKKILIEQLETLNIHGGSVYPDITHMSNYIRNKYLNDNDKTEFEEFDIRYKEEIKELKKKAKEISDTIILPPLPKPSIKETKEILDILSGKKIKKPTIQLVSDFKPDEFWTKKKLNLLKKFASGEELDFDGLKEILDNYYFSNNKPIRDDIRKIMKYKPSLKDSAKVIDELIEEIIALSNSLKSKV